MFDHKLMKISLISGMFQIQLKESKLFVFNETNMIIGKYTNFEIVIKQSQN